MLIISLLLNKKVLKNIQNYALNDSEAMTKSPYRFLLFVHVRPVGACAFIRKGSRPVTKKNFSLETFYTDKRRYGE